MQHPQLANTPEAQTALGMLPSGVAANPMQRVITPGMGMMAPMMPGT